ncbi:MAG TPA: response regulator [Sphingobium sp.]|nr:response regulator [Sphingobium sp.]
MGGKGHVFVVDDESLIRQSLTLLLRSSGYDSRPFSSGDDFLDAAPYLPPGCAIMDVHMPGLDGLQVQDQLRTDRPDIPLIFITGVGDIPTAVRALKKGAVDFIEKPFDDDVLLGCLASAMERVDAQAGRHARRAEAVERMARLTPREAQVLDELVHGSSNKAVAHKLDLSVRTVEMHRARIMRKIGARSLAEAILVALEAGPAADQPFASAGALG